MSWRRRAGHRRRSCPGACRRTSGPCPPGPSTRCGHGSDVPPRRVVHRDGRRGARHQLRAPAHPRAAGVVSVHDLTPVRHPELCDAATLAYPGPDPSGPAARRLGPRRLGLRGRRGGRGLRRRPGPGACRGPGIPALPDARTEAEAEAAGPGCCPGRGRFCLAVGTAEPRKDLPGLVRRLRRGGRRSTPMWPWSWPGRPGWGEEALAARPWPVAGPGPHRAHRVARRRPTWRRCWRGPAVLAYPSLYEGFGFPPLQAMAAGVPVVATRAGLAARGAGRRRRCWSTRATPTASPAPSAPACRTTSCGRRAGGRRPRRGRPATRGSAAAPGWRGSTGTRPADGRGLAVTGAPPRCCWWSSSCAAACPAASAHTPAGCSTGWPVAGARGRRRRRSRCWPAAPPAGPSDPLAAFGLPLVTSALPGPLLTRAWDLGLTRAPRGFDVVHAVSLAAPACAPGRDGRLAVTVHDLAWRRIPRPPPAAGARWHEAALRRAVPPRDALVDPVPAGGGRPGRPAGAEATRVTSSPSGADHLPAPDAAATDALLGPARARRGPFAAQRVHARAPQEPGPARRGLRPGAPLAARALAAGDRRARRLGRRPRAPVACRPRASSSPAPSPTSVLAGLYAARPRLRLRAADRGLRPASARGHARRACRRSCPTRCRACTTWRRDAGAGPRGRPARRRTTSPRAWPRC